MNAPHRHRRRELERELADVPTPPPPSDLLQKVRAEIPTDLRAGLPAQAPQASWGNILTDGKEYIQFAWWLSLFPGLAILITVLGYNLLGEGLRDALDPKSPNGTSKK